MKINKISAKIQKIAKDISKNEKVYDKMNNVVLPVTETTIATGMYAYYIDKNDKIEKDRKPALQYQNIICGVAGLLLAGRVNKSVQKHQSEIIKELEKNKNIQNPESLINGIKIAMPVIVFTSIIRFFIPVISTPISSWIKEKQDNYKQNKLNIIS